MDKVDLLHSWKEISAYLGHSVRCCQVWERKKKLPVHRLDGTPKAHVFAYKKELDRWLETALEVPRQSLWRKLSDFLGRHRG